MMTEMLDVVSLVTSAQHGDRDAFGALYLQFRPTVYAIAFARLRDADQAQEFAQEVLLRAFEKLNQLRQPAAFPGWLRQMALRMLINQVSRDDSLTLVADGVLTDKPAQTPTPVEELICRERAACVERGLGHLRPIDRDTLRAFYFDGQSLETIGQETDVPVGTVKKRLFVARQRLRRELEPVLGYTLGARLSDCASSSSNCVDT
jgi:RNA polymerase sigma-70 factor (ECF subfamily)